LSARQRYVLDCTVLVDFSSTDEEVQAKKTIANARGWLINSISDNSIDLVTSPTILIELARHLYFCKKFNISKVKRCVTTLIRSFDNFKVPEQGIHEVTELCRSLGAISINAQCHAGELSLIPQLFEVGTTYVSSDKNSLKAFKMVDRLNPSFSPPMIIKNGDDIPDA